MKTTPSKKLLMFALLVCTHYLNGETQQNNEFPVEQNFSQPPLSSELQLLLANHFALYTKTLNFHWNVRGDLFNDLHTFFNTLYVEQQGQVDKLAERIRALGSNVQATLASFNQQATIQGQNNVPSALDMVKELHADYQTIINQIKSTISLSQEKQDPATLHLLRKLVQELEKRAWMLHAYLEKPETEQRIKYEVAHRN